MNISYLKTAAAVAVIVAASAAATSSSQAHHAFSAEFDSKKAVRVEGEVTKVQYVNPHSWLYLDVKNADGTTTNWGFEFGTPSGLRNHGIVRGSIPVGSKIEIAGYRAKNGGPFGYSAILTLPDGRKVQTGSAPDAPEAPRI